MPNEPHRPIACIAMRVGDENERRLAEACEVVRVEARAGRDALLHAVGAAEGLLVVNNVRIDDELLSAAPRLRVVSGFGVGYDRVDVAAATRRGVAICNTPGVVTEPVVNLTLGLILAVSRRILEHAAYTRSGAWARGERFPGLGTDLRDKTLGIVGYGRIGRAVARRADAFGLRCIYNDVVHPPPDAAALAEFRPLPDLLRESDFVTLHTDLNPTTQHLIGAPELALMKPAAWLINTSRGPVVDQRALAKAVEGGIAGAALDVLEREPPDEHEPVLTRPNVIALPHVGTATVETRAAMTDLCVQNLLAVIARREPPACVNPEVLG